MTHLKGWVTRFLFKKNNTSSGDICDVIGTFYPWHSKKKEKNLFDLSRKAFDMSVECNFVLSSGFKVTKNTLCEEAPVANVYD